MKHAGADEYQAFFIATLVLLVVLIASFMCIQLYRMRKPAPGCDAARAPLSPQEHFLGRFYYSPACHTGNSILRGACRGISAGAMPSIEVGGDRGGGLCPGMIGVPP